MSEPAMTSGQIISGRYVLSTRIAAGGMGEVWRAQHAILKAPVAIKFLHAKPATHEESRQRFLKEAQLTANLKSRYAVQVFDFGVTDDGRPYLVMDLLEGETLAERIRRRWRLSAADTITLLRQCGRALDRAHDLGIVHRDFKPENIVIVANEDGSEDAKVLDFGIARLAGDWQAEELGADPAADGKPLTQTGVGTLLGTPYYMSPEQIDYAHPIGVPTDIWALGVVAYECLVGKPPFVADSVDGILGRILKQQYPKAAELELGIPAEFDAWFKTACAKDPGQRFARASLAVTQLALALGIEDGSPASRLSSQEIVPVTIGQPEADAVPDRQLAVTMAPPVEAPEELPPTPRVSIIDMVAILMAIVVLVGTLLFALR
jgi:serine/threonine-protein kinase